MKKQDKSDKKRLRFLIIGILLLVMTISGICLLRAYIIGKRAEDEYNRLAELAQSQSTEATTLAPETDPVETEEIPPPYNSPIDFETLMQINPDIVGWVRIPDTNIDYPIVQTDDNDYYLHTDFEGEESVYGAIFLDFASQSDIMGKNNIIYGHHMRNGSMFKDLVRFKDQEYFNDHQYFEIYTPERTIKLKAVSCYYAKADAKARQTVFATDESYQSFVKESLEPCAYAEIPEEPVTALYTFVTCSYELEDARTFLYAVEIP